MVAAAGFSDPELVSRIEWFVNNLVKRSDHIAIQKINFVHFGFSYKYGDFAAAIITVLDFCTSTGRW